MDEIGDTVGNRPGFAGSGAGEDEKRTVRGRNGFALSRIQIFEYGVTQR
jgi:hypothetical protein